MPGSAAARAAGGVLRPSPAAPVTTRAVTVTPSGTVREIDLGSRHGHIDALYRAIGSHHLDMITVTPHLLMWVDHQGLVTGSPVNQVATTLLTQIHPPRSHPVHGTVVFTGPADPTGDGTSLAPEWAQVLQSHPDGNEPT
jgi:uncharacterized protein DUF3846